MLFDPFESIILLFSVLTVNYIVQDGKSNWLEGMILVCLYVPAPLTDRPSSGADTELGRRYVIVAVVFWLYPGTKPTGILTCSVDT